MVANESLIAFWCLHGLLSFQKELTHYTVHPTACQEKGFLIVWFLVVSPASTWR
jgi:hypothetical protein